MGTTVSLKKATIINAAAKYSNVFFQVIATAILARILSPEDYGIVAVVTVFSTFFRVSKNIINETLIFFRGSHSKRLDLPNGYMVEQSFRNIRIFPRSMVEDFAYKKEVAENILKTDDFIIEFSGVYLNKELTIRNRRKGDKLKNKKLKDIFIDKHIELFDRDRAVVIEDNGLIIWVENITKNNNISINRNGKEHG